MTLDKLKRGSKARITCMGKTHACCCRLRELGLQEGQEVEALGKAPFGDPYMFLIRGIRLCLRGRDCREIGVTPC